MNHSIHSLDRSTHRKIVVLALVAAIATVGFAIGSHVDSSRATASLVKAGQPVVVTGLTAAVIR